MAEPSAKNTSPHGYQETFINKVFPTELIEIAKRRENIFGNNGSLKSLNMVLRNVYYKYEEQKILKTPTGCDGALEALGEKYIKEKNNIRLVGLALSGGGIRSATFNLGVIQALAKFGVLKYVDYLSTVSGGGFIGSCLSSLLNNTTCKKEHIPLLLNKKEAENTLDAANEPPAIRHLRNNSNYIAPNGLLDYIRIPALLLRGAVINLIAILPYLVFAVLLVNFCCSFPKIRPYISYPNTIYLTTIIFLGGAIAFMTVWLWHERTLKERESWEKAFALSTTSVLLVGMLYLFSLAFSYCPGDWKSFTGAVSVIISFVPVIFSEKAAGKISSPVSKIILYAAGFLGPFILFIIYSMLQYYVSPCFLLSGDNKSYIYTNLIVVLILLIWIFIAIIRPYTNGEAVKNQKAQIRNGNTPQRTPLYIALFVEVLILFYLCPAVWFLNSLLQWTSLLWWVVAEVVLLCLLVWSYPVIRNECAMGQERFQRAFYFACFCMLFFIIYSWGWLFLSHSLHWSIWVWWVTLFIYLPVWVYNEAEAASKIQIFFYIALSVEELILIYLYRRELSFLNSTLHWTLWVWYAAICIFLWARNFLDINRTSLHGFYRDRLSKAYLFRLDENKIQQDDASDKQKLSELNKEGSIAPYHLINVALNIQGSKHHNFRGRNADFFLLSKHFCGSRFTDYCETKTIENNDPHFNLGTAMAISGGAVSPNMGKSTSMPLTFIMALLNLRLGYWLPNPYYLNTYRLGWWRIYKYSLRNVVGPGFLMWELIAGVNEKSRYVNLSDGGHIENLAVYQLLQRHCKYIIVCDAEEDPDLKFGGLATLMRYARIDMGIEIEINLDKIRKGKDGFSRAHCTLGTIRYNKDEIGYMLYIKASLTGDEGEDVLEYRSRSPQFPHEPTFDQLFDEEQFEAYRALGYHIGEALSKEYNIEYWFGSSLYSTV